MLLVDVTYILNLGKVKVRVINMLALPIQCVLTLWIQIIVMGHVYCIGSHMYSRFLRYLLQLLVSLYHMATSNPVANNTLVDQYWLQAKLL